MGGNGHKPIHELCEFNFYEEGKITWDSENESEMHAVRMNLVSFPHSMDTTSAKCVAVAPHTELDARVHSISCRNALTLP